MDPKGNPYTPGSGVTPPELVGRDHLIEQFDISLSRRLDGLHSKNYLIIGLRGVGKTVLLNSVIDMAQVMGYEVVKVEVETVSRDSGKGYVEKLAAGIRRILLPLTRGVVSSAVNKALSVVRLFSVTLPEGVSVKIDPVGIDDYSGFGILEDDLTTLIEATGEAAAARKKGILIVLDEAQNLTKPELAATIAALHQTAQRNLPVLLVGAGLPHLRGRAGEAKTYSERFFEFPELGSLDDDDAKSALVLPAQRKGVSIRGDALEHMVAVSRGYPYFIQEWGNHAWNVAQGKVIKIDDIKIAAPLVEESLDNNFFQVRMDQLTSKEIEYLIAMAQLGEGPHRSSQIAEKLSTKMSSIAPRRSKLIEKGMIYSPARGRTAFTVPLFHEFLQKQSARAPQKLDEEAR